MVTSLLSDVVYRVSLDEVTELPDIIYRSVKVDLPRRLRAQYMNMLHESVVALDSGRVVNAVHAGARVQKLLQICSGAIYDEQGVYHDIHTERHALALDLVEETDAQSSLSNGSTRKKDSSRRPRNGKSIMPLLMAAYLLLSVSKSSRTTKQVSCKSFLPIRNQQGTVSR